MPIVARTPNGLPIIRTDNPHVQTDISNQIIKEIISGATISKPTERIIIEHDFRKIIGYSNCVQVDANDICFYGQRMGRKGKSHLVLNRIPEPTQFVTLILEWVQKYRQWHIISGYFGTIAPREPYDIGLIKPNEFEESLRFWLGHALVYEIDKVVPGSEQQDCPWQII